MPEGDEHSAAAGTATERLPGPGGLFEQLLKVRFVAVVVVILSFLHSLAFLFLGARSAIETYLHILGVGGAAMERPALELLHSLDFFLVSLVLLILSLGVAKLFLLPPAAPHSRRLPSWLDVETFSDLKYLLWETILTTLLIAALPLLTAGLFGEVEWVALASPAAIFLLALSLYFMKKE
jgi:uncharacterized membrane protein YqhA